MYSIPIPKENALHVFCQCISRIQDSEKKNRLHAIETDVDNATVIYVTTAHQSALHTLSSADYLSSTVTNVELKKVYRDGMVRRTSAGRQYYDQLMLSAALSKCPYCGHNQVRTLDHVLPEMHFPLLVVSPQNLVPSCSDCNRRKSSHFPHSGEEQVIHPYFDDCNSVQWLFAKVLKRSPVSIQYFTDPPQSINELLRRRIEHHFNLFDLGHLYSCEAATELASISYRLSKLHDNMGSTGVKQHLQDSADSFASHKPNSWKTAMYNALALDDWFCNSGYTMCQ